MRTDRRLVRSGRLDAVLRHWRLLHHRRLRSRRLLRHGRLNTRLRRRLLHHRWMRTLLRYRRLLHHRRLHTRLRRRRLGGRTRVRCSVSGSGRLVADGAVDRARAVVHRDDG
ncbi:hypothetical protein ABZX36_30050, partial [Nocardia sp. NPDC003239]|uniref:hypothetical protein n=1 Tax=Nocardia sp. NPDC003239 TaxID=3154445 RepID=UPI0033A164D1